MQKRNSGARARAWRRNLAASARRPSDTTRTLKFKLKTGDTPPFPFAKAVDLYNITDGVGPGSLTGLLLAAHLNGFCLFEKKGETALFRNRAAFDDPGFAAAFERETGLLLPGFLPTKIHDCLNSEVRARKGKDNRFVAEVIAVEYAKRLSGKTLDTLPPEEAGLFQGMGDTLASHFKDWQELKKRTQEACRRLDQFFKQQGWQLPSIAHMVAQMKPLAPANSTLAFDPNAAEPASDIQGYEPHVVVAMRLRDARKEGRVGNELRKRVQQMITTGNNAGLSWLYGVGLGYLQSCRVDEAQADFLVPDSRLQALERLLDFAKAIPADPLFSKTQYAKFRMLVGGRLDSWIANYLNRLDQLEGLLPTPLEPLQLPGALSKVLAADFFRGAGIDHAGLQALLGKLERSRAAAQAAYAPVAGKAETLPERSHFDAIEDFSALLESIAGVLSMLRNQIERSSENAADQAIQQLARECLFDIPDWVKGLPAINKLHGGIPDFESEVRQAITDFDEVRAAMRQHAAAIAGYAEQEGKPLNPLARFADQERRHLGRLKHGSARMETDPDKRAVQILLDRFGRAARRCSEATMLQVKAQYDEWGVFINAKESNRYFHNRLGRLFRHVFAKSNHQAYAINFAALGRVDILAGLEQLLRQIKQTVFQPSGIEQGRVAEFLKLERTYYSLLISGLAVEIPSELAQPRLAEHLLEIPSVLKVRLSEKKVGADVAQKVFNLYMSVLGGLNVVANREHFFVRVRFQRVGDNELLYVPKDKHWTAPKRLWNCASPIRSVLESPHIQWKDETEQQIQVVDTIKSLARQGIALKRPLAEYLVQSPHDWGYSLDVKNTASRTKGLPLSKGKLKKLAEKKNTFSLAGPSSFKNVLDRFLTEPARFSAGDITLIVDNQYRQHVHFDAQGTPSVEFEDLGYTASIAVPVSEKAPEHQPDFSLADRYVAIDQGERGIAYAVFDAKDGTLQDTGTVTIRSIRNLIRAASRYRRQGQPSQKFQQRYDSTLFVMRENVVGDVCHAITNLMRQYKAFPVLEGTVRNLEGGSKQLDLVYKSVSIRFLYSETEAHKTARKSYWAGSDLWTHPYLKQWERDADGKPTQKTKPLNLFPGVSGPTAGTSQACSKCGRNPYEDIRQLIGQGIENVPVEKGGKVVLPRGQIALKKAPDPWSEEGKEFRRRKMRAQLTIPIAANSLPINELKSVVRRNLRRPNPSIQSRDTTQSQYHCVYCDCEAVQHADINAAINIGTRFRQERLICDEP